MINKIRCEKGDKGPKGCPGKMGSRGPDGCNGIKGLNGPKGDKGSLGNPGYKGKKGPDGFQGPFGENGDNGAKGNKGDKGLPGDDGTSFRIFKDFTSVSELDDHKEYPNNKGQLANVSDGTGKGLYVYFGPHEGDTGYLNSFEKAANYTPGNTAGAKGSKGETGLQGPTGATGKQGIMGAQGPYGPTGPTGISGPKGEKGAPNKGSKGNQGTTGLTGDKGIPGSNAPNGSNGVKGDTGPPGSSGEPGIKGTLSPVYWKGVYYNDPSKVFLGINYKGPVICGSNSKSTDATDANLYINNNIYLSQYTTPNEINNSVLACNEVNYKGNPNYLLNFTFRSGLPTPMSPKGNIIIDESLIEEQPYGPYTPYHTNGYQFILTVSPASCNYGLPNRKIWIGTYNPAGKQWDYFGEYYLTSDLKWINSTDNDYTLQFNGTYYKIYDGTNDTGAYLDITQTTLMTASVGNDLGPILGNSGETPGQAVMKYATATLPPSSPLSDSQITTSATAGCLGAWFIFLSSEQHGKYNFTPLIDVRNHEGDQDSSLTLTIGLQMNNTNSMPSIFITNNSSQSYNAMYSYQLIG